MGEGKGDTLLPSFPFFSFPIAPAWAGFVNLASGFTPTLSVEFKVLATLTVDGEQETKSVPVPPKVREQPVKFK